MMGTYFFNKNFVKLISLVLKFSVKFLVSCTLFIYFFFRWISQIFFGPRRIYFCCPQHLFGRHQFVYVSRHDYCCSWRWWLKNLNFFFQISKFLGIFSSRRQNSFWRKKNLKQNWVRNSLVLFVLLYVTYITLSPFFKKFQNLNLQNFFYKKNLEFIFFFVL